MWTRSQVERLTGLSKKSIQRLCYQNTSRSAGGLGVWRPAESRPGYSRFDDGDLVVLYLLGRFRAAGFSTPELPDVLGGLADADPGALLGLLAEKRADLEAERRRIEGRLALVDELSDAAASGAAPGDAATSIALGCCLAELRSAVAREGVAAGAGAGDGLAPATEPAVSAAELDRALEEFANGLADLMGRGDSPDSAPARGLVRDAASRVVAAMGEGAATGVDAGSRDAVARLLRAAAGFLERDENGTFVEVMFGAGSAAFLRVAVRACLEGEGATQAG